MSTYKCAIIEYGDYSGRWLMVKSGDNWISRSIPPHVGPINQVVSFYIVVENNRRKHVVFFKEDDNQYTETNGISWMPLPGIYDATNRMRWMWWDKNINKIVAVSSTHECYIINNLWTGDMQHVGTSPASGAEMAQTDYWLSEGGVLHVAWRTGSKNDGGPLSVTNSQDYGATWRIQHLLDRADQRRDAPNRYGLDRFSINGIGETVHVFFSTGSYTLLEEVAYNGLSMYQIEKFTWVVHNCISFNGIDWLDDLLDRGEGLCEAYWKRLTTSSGWSMIEMTKKGSRWSGTLPIRRLLAGRTDAGLYLIYYYVDAPGIPTPRGYCWRDDSNSKSAFDASSWPYLAHIMWPYPGYSEIEVLTRDYVRTWVGADTLQVGMGMWMTPAAIWDPISNQVEELFWYGGYNQIQPRTLIIPSSGAYSLWW